MMKNCAFVFLIVVGLFHLIERCWDDKQPKNLFRASFWQWTKKFDDDGKVCAIKKTSCPTI
jgi:hypothetical protein